MLACLWCHFSPQLPLRGRPSGRCHGGCSFVEHAQPNDSQIAGESLHVTCISCTKALVLTMPVCKDPISSCSSPSEGTALKREATWPAQSPRKPACTMHRRRFMPSCSSSVIALVRGDERAMCLNFRVIRGPGLHWRCLT